MCPPSPAPRSPAPRSPEPRVVAPERRRHELLAVEHGLTRDQLRQVTGDEETARDVDLWLDTELAEGRIAPHPPSSHRAWDGAGPRLALQGELAQRRLRRLARDGGLEAVVEEGRRQFGVRSMGEVTAALQRGDLAGFDRAYARRVKLAPVDADSWLRASICDAFDPAWLERTYEDQTEVVVGRVLGEALEHAAPCDTLYRWVDARSPEASTAEVASRMAQQAILRGEPEAAMRHAAALPERLRTAIHAAVLFVEGDLTAAQSALDGAIAGRKKAPDCGHLAPILALLLLERDQKAATSQARRFITAAGPSTAKGQAKAFRALLKHHERDEGDVTSLHVQQLPPQAGAWQRLLTGYLAASRLEWEATRGAWAKALVHDGLRWTDHGYRWWGRQALLLARQLHEEHARRALREASAHVADLARPQEPPELSLWNRLSPKPAWQKALAAVTQLASSIHREADTAYRVGWVVEVASASLSRPLLQQLDAGGTWSTGRRVAISELEAVADRLPPEDREVVRRLTGPDGDREALEALIGHERVFDGARGMTPVVVVRGRCRVETRDARGGIAVVVEPQGARAGLHAVAEGHDRIAVYRVDAAFDQLARTLPEGLFVPAEGETQLLEVLAQLASGVEVSGPHLADERPVSANPTPCVRIAAKAGAYIAQVGVRPFGEEGRWLAAGQGAARLRRVAEGQRLWCERDLEEERRQRARLLATCPSLSEEDDATGGDSSLDAAGREREALWSFDEVGLLGLLSELSHTSVPHALEWRGARGLLLAGTVSRASLRGHLRCLKGWYVAQGTAHLDRETETTLTQLVGLPTLADGRFIRISPGAYVEVESHLLRAMAALRAAARDGTGLKLHGAALPSLSALLEGPLAADEASRAWLERVEQTATKRYRLPRGLSATLRDYQHRGYRWLRRLCELGIGACLADDMGLGKTVQIIALLLARARGGPSLVVAPTSVCSNWARELARFAPGLEVVDYAGPQRKEWPPPGAGTVVITSYAILQQDIDELAAISWEVAVLDEAQLIKNPGSLRARAAYRLTASARIAATGTPIENNVGDLWAIFRFLNPGLLGPWKPFRRRFVLAIERDGSVEAREALRGLVDPYILRRLKRDVLQSLPALTEVELQVDFDEAEAALHAMLQRDIRDKLQRGRGRRGHELEVLAAITKLRRFCCHPRLVYPDVDVRSAKVEALLTLVEELRQNGHRALVFSQFVDLLDLVRERLAELRIDYAYLDGSTPRAARQPRVDAFQNGDVPLFLISLKAGGFGLNLTGADYVIHLDPWWNPAVEAQATDRAHRIGQTRPVTVYRLVTKGTIEEKIIALQASKRDLAEAILEPRQASPELRADDLLGLLG